MYDLQVCADGWTMLTTGPRTRSAPDSAAVEVAAESMTVSLYHAKSGLAASFRASAGCFRAGLQQALLVWRDEDRLTQGPVWSVTALDLADLQAHARTAVADTPPPPQVTNKQWRAPIDLRSTPGTLALHWTLQLQNADAFDKASHRDRVSAACLDLTSDPSLPSLRVASRTRGDLLSVSLKDFSHLLSSHGETAPAALATPAPQYTCVVGPTPPLHAWSIGKLLYVLTKAGELHQCNIGAAVPQYVGSAPLPLAQLPE